MFGLFGSHPPLSNFDRAWVESRFQAVLDWRGVERIRSAALTTMNDLVPGGAWSGNEDEFARLWIAVCDRLQLDSRKISFASIDDETADQRGAGFVDGEQPIIMVPKGRMAQALPLTAFLIRELTRAAIAERMKAPGAPIDLPSAVDIVGICAGFGPMIAHWSGILEATAVKSPAEWQSLLPRGFLNPRQVGYALGLYELVCGTARSDWNSLLSGEVARILNECVKYVRKTGNCLVNSAATGASGKQTPPSDLLGRLNSDSGSARIAALWALQQQDGEALPESAVNGVLKCLRDKDVAVRMVAAGLLTRKKFTHPQLLRDVLELTRSGDKAERITAVNALTAIGTDHPEVINRFCQLIADDSTDVAEYAAAALVSQNRTFPELVRPLLGSIHTSMSACDGRHVTLIEKLVLLTDEPEQQVREFYEDLDEVYAEDVLAIIYRIRTGEDPPNDADESADDEEPADDDDQSTSPERGAFRPDRGTTRPTDE